MQGVVEDAVLRRWLAGRSLARGLAAPVADAGGWRVETGSADEVRRWVFSGVCEGLVGLGRDVVAPGHVLKLCGGEADLRAVLPARWRMGALAWFMMGGGVRFGGEVPEGYVVETDVAGGVVTVRIVAAGGVVAARGFAAAADGALVYDRILVLPEHGRRGLGRAVMAALQGARTGVGEELLVATAAGRGLYDALGWRVVSPYATAVITGG